MKKNSCLKKTKITIAYSGPCSKLGHALFSNLSECDELRGWICLNLEQWHSKIENWRGGGHIFIYLSSQTVKTIDFKTN